MIKASVESSNFSFTAYGANPIHARSVLVKGFLQHAKDYGLRQDWWEDIAGDILLEEIAEGAAYRDREQIPCGRALCSIEEIASVEIRPITGYGSQGCSANLIDAKGVSFGMGQGETEAEALTEALCAAGLTLAQALDAGEAVAKSARVYR